MFNRYGGLEGLQRDLMKFAAESAAKEEDQSSFWDGYYRGRASTFELAAVWVQREIDNMRAIDGNVVSIYNSKSAS